MAARLTWRLAQHVEERGIIGTLYAGGTAFQLPGKAHSETPALAFVARERRGTARGVTPDLVVEFLSSPGSDLAIADWLQAGTRAVLAIDPASRTVTLYQNRADVRVLGEHDFLELPDLLPGWALRVGDLFE